MADCVVKDMSAQGARLRVRDGKTVPQQFELVIAHTGESRPARVCWRTEKEVGVSFMPERRTFGRRVTPPPGSVG